MSSLSLSGVSKRYGDAVALSDVSLTVEDGEFFTLVGPSGCGKTTTLRTIAGFETPTEGTVAFGGEPMGTTPPEERSVGVVFQQYALFPHLSVGENVAYGLRFTDHPDPDARVAELLDLVGLDGFRDREPGELSGGQQQRVALARALAPEPDVLLLDEPMSALDARLRQRLRREVRAIQRDLGVTTVYVTHDQAEALAVSDRVAVFSDGEVEQVGTPQAVYRNPKTRFVAEFVGENNVFDGEVRDGRFPIGDERVPVDAPDGHRTVCLRPDALAVGDGEYALTGTVTDAEFLGSSVRVTLAWQNRELTVQTESVPAVGDRLTVAFDPADLVLVG
ncbi:ABC transporter ATP-binding protein [Halosegnis longus]|uniref:ABC transporter ATP-binding protein n=1 Tax=Halosegnis longus TaxID=2216012 RepID=UPI00129D99D0|nr:ABC transporter ATP-binding protein [Halosegnis longus]